MPVTSNVFARSSADGALPSHPGPLCAEPLLMKMTAFVVKPGVSGCGNGGGGGGGGEPPPHPRMR
jgi:hypothetical protein